ncbi:MAG: hypothetical protein QGF67_08430, partial [Lentisphaeria bacterium]|nr:hypothetical protein [Lentisphaeria bacterium]
DNTRLRFPPSPFTGEGNIDVTLEFSNSYKVVIVVWHILCNPLELSAAFTRESTTDKVCKVGNSRIMTGLSSFRESTTKGSDNGE